jgi:hypothetical protein
MGFYITHGDPHPTRGKTKGQRQEQIETARSKAIKDGRLWKLQHMDATDNDAIDAASVYSMPHAMDDSLADAMMEGFMWGTQKVESVPSLGWHLKDLTFLIRLKGYTYRRSKGDLIIQTDKGSRTYSDDYHGIQVAFGDMLNEFEEVVYG